MVAALAEAKQEWSTRLLKTAANDNPGTKALGALAAVHPDDNLVGIGTGEKIVGGKPTGVHALKFFVKVKYPLDHIAKRSRLPSQVQGLPVDVEEVGVLVAQRKPHRSLVQQTDIPDPRIRIRPAQPGSSIGFEDPLIKMAGTFGAVVRSGKTLYILSNNHVIANEDHLPVGSAIYQPGLLDGGDVRGDKIGEFTKAVSLQPNEPNKVDCAIARAVPQSIVSREILHVGAPQGTAAAAIDMRVHKFGRTTAYRVGRVTSVDTDVKVEYETGTLVFQNQIIIAGLDMPFSAAGDSGSLILERGTQRAVGLLFAGSDRITIANHIQDVLEALDVVLA
jgi:S1-C subfamily serine protease